MNNLEDVYAELTNVFWDVFGEYSIADKGSWDEFYFQGKKDGLRMALAVLSPLVTEDEFWETQRQTSNKGRATRFQQAMSLLKYAYEAIDDWAEFPHENRNDMERWKALVRTSTLMED